MAAGKYSELIRNLPEGVQTRSVAVLHLNLGICYQFMGRLQQAIESVERALQTDPAYDKAYFRKVQILVAMGR